jgi:hypothetical protein
MVITEPHVTDPSSLRFELATRAQLRRGLMARGQILATLLAEVLSGKRPPTLVSMLAEKPGLRPEEVLRQALDQVESRRRLLDAQDERYGRCDTCGIDLGIERLTEMPWADRCAAHHSRTT